MILKDKEESEKVPKADLDVFHKYSQFSNPYKTEFIVSYCVHKINPFEILIAILSQLGAVYIYSLHFF